MHRFFHDDFLPFIEYLYGRFSGGIFVCLQLIVSFSFIELQNILFLVIEKKFLFLLCDLRFFSLIAVFNTKLE